eukprot:TRINITY_DN704_c4_g1_i1.p1 TRINITY_DN704_c4_g1~~TRINITY_DN704_c4_g1_i1.p1  ORF type:complete len:273 (-),score=104.49 TRINITY_DN704_c4_g1_i1:195-977(-)
MTSLSPPTLLLLLLPLLLLLLVPSTTAEGSTLPDMFVGIEVLNKGLAESIRSLSAGMPALYPGEEGVAQLRVQLTDYLVFLKASRDVKKTYLYKALQRREFYAEKATQLLGAQEEFYKSTVDFAENLITLASSPGGYNTARAKYVTLAESYAAILMDEIKTLIRDENGQLTYFQKMGIFRDMFIEKNTSEPKEKFVKKMLPQLFDHLETVDKVRLTLLFRTCLEAQTPKSKKKLWELVSPHITQDEVAFFDQFDLAITLI